MASLRLPTTSINLQRLPAEPCPNRVEGPPHAASPREGTLEPSHPRKVGQHEPDQDGENALPGDTGKGEDHADEDEGNPGDVLEDRDSDAHPDRPGRWLASGREVVGGNTYDEEGDHRETRGTRHDKYGENCADPGSGKTDPASEDIQEIDHGNGAVAPSILADEQDTYGTSIQRPFGYASEQEALDATRASCADAEQIRLRRFHGLE